MCMGTVGPSIKRRPGGRSGDPPTINRRSGLIVYAQVRGCSGPLRRMSSSPSARRSSCATARAFVSARATAPTRQLLLRGFERLSPESRYRRFLAAMPELSEETVRSL